MKLERIIAVRTSKTVYRDGELCIKVFGDDYAKSRILAEAATHAKIEETGLDVPKILEVTKTEGKWAIVSEFIAGKTIERLMDEEPEKRGEYMSRFVDAQIRINSTKARGLAKLKERIEESLFEAGLSSATLYDLHMKLESLPQGDKVCHGDFAPSNLIACGDGRDCAVLAERRDRRRGGIPRALLRQERPAEIRRAGVDTAARRRAPRRGTRRRSGIPAPLDKRRRLRIASRRKVKEMIKIKVCIGSACHVKGSRRVVEGLQYQIAERKLKDKINLGGVFCMGRCDEGVCVTVDDKFYSVKPEEVTEFFEKEVLPLVK